MEKFWGTAIDESGAPIDAATITVYLTGTSTIASLFSDKNGNTPKDNPFNADDVGRFSFYAADSRYDIKITKAGLDDYTLQDIQLIDSDSILKLAGGIMTGALTMTTGQKIYLNTAQTAYLIYADSAIKVYVNDQLIMEFTP
jgi:hypothetical protein